MWVECCVDCLEKFFVVEFVCVDVDWIELICDGVLLIVLVICCFFWCCELNGGYFFLSYYGVDDKFVISCYILIELVLIWFVWLFYGWVWWSLRSRCRLYFLSLDWVCFVFSFLWEVRFCLLFLVLEGECYWLIVWFFRCKLVCWLKGEVWFV